MAEQITREELYAFAEANKEQAAALSKLSSLVEVNGRKLDEIIEQMEDCKESVKSEVVDSIIGKSDDGSRTTLTAIKKDTTSTAENIKRGLFIVTSITLIAGIAAVVANILFRQLQDNAFLRKEVSVLTKTEETIKKDISK